jgi:hypothetical protein
LREYPWYPPGQQRWIDRVSYERDGETRRLSDSWPKGGPWWVRYATRAFEITTCAPFLPAVRLLVWLAGASTSHRANPRIAIDTPAVLPSATTPYQETIG